MQARRAAAVRVCVDFGGSSTCVALAVGGRLPQVVLVDGASLLPSAVFAEHDGTLLVGAEALRKAEVDPTRCEPHPKRHLDEGRLLLGDAVVEVLDVVTAVLDRAVTEARGVAGGAVVDELVLTHPAQWGALRTRLLRQAGVGLAAETLLCQEPVAAAMFHAARREMPAGAVFAVLDLGGTTVHASVLRCEPAGGFTVLATRGDPHFGGDDLDELMIELAREGIPADRQAQWRELLAGDDLARRSSLRVLRADARSAREALSA
ncbi:MAG: Hsp70 family protein, partial [Sciscionella sp.]